MSAASFVITVDGVEVATFSGLAGISSEVQPASTSGGSTGTTSSSQLGQLLPQTVTLTRNYANPNYVWDWHVAAIQGVPTARRTCTLQVQDAGGKILANFVLQNAWPTKVDVAGVQSGDSQLVTETDEFLCDQILPQ